MAEFNSIKAGYIGLLNIGGLQIRCTELNANPSQNIVEYPHTLGLNDFITDETRTKVEEVGNIQLQKAIVRPGVELVQGNFSYPATQSNVSSIYEYARTGNYITTVSFTYSCGITRIFNKCRMSQFTFSVTAGDIVNISGQFTAMNMAEGEDDEAGTYTVAEKLLTWDTITINGVEGNLHSFELTIQNEIIPIYTANPSAYNDNIFGPRDLRIGKQDVSGNVTTYNRPEEIRLTGTAAPEAITVAGPGISFNINGIKTPLQINSQLGPVYIVVPFTGVGYALGQ